ncbi:glycoside hydrolase family 132 protein [Cucurbitaria berberidis CBS 394.84]|uniref:Glycoside hydrolase family 132 protein n=1 Tax=Cucurbitaria berberidis CBS 394.84 TaxID=1168544 RepID=A0A9P4GQC6_9PLEO|nr:glycoside hydrolase family 132 protein [Cucurbitaria berberidis CBS 394.84]KAF1849399.1 glycoside hydrolase family 132 protein [Cucurbitaria berberidis CBS 394.84]
MRLQHITILAAVAAVTVANPHAYVHRHAYGAAKRDSRPDHVVYVPAATETEIVYVLDGHSISEEEVRQGIANGTLMWGEDGNLSTSIISPVFLTTPPSVPDRHAQSAEASSGPKLQESKSWELAPPAETPSSNPTPHPSPNPSMVHQQDTSSKAWADLVDKNGHCSSCDKEFPNGKIPCSEFPYGYGALPLAHEGLGGWSGIQDPQYRGVDGFDDIYTVRKGSCNDGSCCTAGNFCSYGCPNPYLKLSFPKKQGRTGQSVGGLYCNEHNYLEMAEGSIGKTLCGKGSTSMTIKVENKLSKSVSFCRTDYPGTESMTFPLTLGPGETGFLANPDQAKYYFWQGKATSAQYYVNKQGVPESEACTWGETMKGKGNWAPTIFGTSWDDINMNRGYSSLSQNLDCKQERLDYDITFTGDGVISPCRYKSSTNQYCQADTCFDDKDRGCTASTNLGGTLIIILSDD